MTRLSTLTEVMSHASPIARPEDDPQVREYSTRQATLSQALAQARAHHARLVTDRQQLQESGFASNVDALVHGNEGTEVDAFVADVARLDTEIASTQTRIDALVAALAQVAQLTKAAQREAAQRIEAEYRARALALVREMRPLVKQLDRLETAFFSLRGRTGRGPGFWPPPIRTFNGQPLSSWLTQATLIVQE